MGFIRYEDREVDVVTIVFGKPANPPPSQSPTPSPHPARSLPPSLSRSRWRRRTPSGWTSSGGLGVNVTVTNTADLEGRCTYAANPAGNPLLPVVNRNFEIGAKARTLLSFTAPPPFSKFRVVVACNGTFNGQNVEFGRVEQDVSG